MNSISLFGQLLCRTYTANGSDDPIERYYASMFASYFDWQDCQPSCASVKAITKGEQAASRKLLRFYRDSAHPRCPEKLRSDLDALINSRFLLAGKRRALRNVLEAFWEAIPEEDAEDLRQIVCTEDLAQMWTCLTWYALCADQYGKASY